MKESQVERRLVEGVRKLGGVCMKFVSPGTPGVPDRLIITATGRIIFAELKTETGRLPNASLSTYRKSRPKPGTMTRPTLPWKPPHKA